jgi:hypothetical protein
VHVHIGQYIAKALMDTGHLQSRYGRGPGHLGWGWGYGAYNLQALSAM